MQNEATFCFLQILKITKKKKHVTTQTEQWVCLKTAVNMSGSFGNRFFWRQDFFWTGTMAPVLVEPLSPYTAPDLRWSYSLAMIRSISALLKQAAHSVYHCELRYAATVIAATDVDTSVASGRMSLCSPVCRPSHCTGSPRGGGAQLPQDGLEVLKGPEAEQLRIAWPCRS